jgi:hypothetical protein
MSDEASPQFSSVSDHGENEDVISSNLDMNGDRDPGKACATAPSDACMHIMIRRIGIPSMLVANSLLPFF